LSAAQLTQLGKTSARLLSVLDPDHKKAATMLKTRDPAHS